MEVKDNYEQNELSSIIQTTHSREKKVLIIAKSFSLVLLASIVYLLNKAGFKANQSSDDFCMFDAGHLWTKYFNDLVHTNKGWLSFFEITSSGIMDLVMLNMMISWYLSGRTGQILWTVIVFYVSRAIIQENFKFRFTDLGIWDDPGIPSLVVPYGLQSDYYFSGHCGFLTINSAHMWQEKRYITSVLIAICISYMAFVLIMSQIHYTIDIPIGIFYGYYLFIIVRPHVTRLDFYASRASTKIYRWIKSKCSKGELEQ